jgi:fused signal recognition particle receptor
MPLVLNDISSTAVAIAIVVVAALLLLLLVLLLRARKRHRKSPLPPALAERPEALAPSAPSAAELERREQAAGARQRAEALAQQRREAAEAAKTATAEADKTRLLQEAQSLKQREEEAKRESYRAQKAAEQAAKDRHKQEQEERLRLKALADQAARAESEAQEQARQQEELRKIQAEAGQTLAEGLSKTRTQGFMARLNGLFRQPQALDESTLAELEEILFTADIGVQTASRLVGLAREKIARGESLTGERVKEAIRDEIQKMVDLPVKDTLSGGGPPQVVMVVGVNGSGKTTTIGKLAAQLRDQGKKVVLAAGDTFRAAATEQLDVWAERAGARLVTGPENGDPGAVVFEAIKSAREHQADVVLADTAGRLHTKGPLMEELKKVRRVMDKALPGAPHEVLLVLDATTGQNAIAQARQFREVVGVTAIALTKLDGTAKGGVIIGICDELKIPVAWIGIGEKVTDLRRFEPRDFVAALFD